jgi:hypothetical protein
MPYPKTVAEVQSARTTLETKIFRLVKEFELETSTVVDSILCWAPNEREGTNRVKVRVTINALADEVTINVPQEATA